MTAMTCPDCHQPVSSLAAACPSCGRPATSIQWARLILGIPLLLFAAVLLYVLVYAIYLSATS